MDDIPANTRQTRVFQHDEEPKHFSRDTRDYLYRIYPQRWNSIGGPVEWLFSDLIPMDFLLWRYIKSTVYDTLEISDIDLVVRIVEAVSRVGDKLA
ncbi:hypothetical protein AVEN_92129-1 [Araneus ventricosus]|uniref:Tc1-like transposase DDE domain-containing protein n=1 Tax=Araneus ventricosus TaxID=182803 RepID=A0A4Y2VRY6_ARAVE|nr:hypothetical protein AVEN_92129-1 [Araneus ventricosus]